MDDTTQRVRIVFIFKRHPVDTYILHTGVYFYVELNVFSCAPKSLQRTDFNSTMYVMLDTAIKSFS